MEKDRETNVPEAKEEELGQRLQHPGVESHGEGPVDGETPEGEDDLGRQWDHPDAEAPAEGAEEEGAREGEGPLGGGPEWDDSVRQPRQPLGRRLLIPVNDTFNGLDNRQKGIYILSIGIAAILAGIGLLISLIVKLS